MVRIEEKPSRANLPLQQSLDRSSWRRRRRGGCCSCILLLVFFAGVILLLLSIQLGIASVPVLSSLLYHVPQPTRIVTVPHTDEPAIQGIAVTISEQGTASLHITEEQLTALLRQSAMPFADRIAASTLQAVITPEYIELTARVLKPLGMTVITQVTPVIAAGALSLIPKRLQIGVVTLPIDAISPAFQFMFGSMMEQLTTSIRDMGTIRDIHLDTGVLDISGLLTQTQ